MQYRIMHRLVTSHILMALLLGGLRAASTEPFATQVVREIQAKMPAWIVKTNTPGVAIAVVDDRTILWQEVYGHTSRNTNQPITPRTLFSIQSMSKSFTALGVLMAVQDGLLDLDAPISDYVPEFTVHSRYEDHPERRITMRHLLSHRAGFTHEAPVGSNFESRPVSFAEHILSIPDTWLRYPVGYRFAYSNLGVDLAGAILEKETGKPFIDYIREKVLLPIGMTDSTLDSGVILKASDRALGHLAPKDVVPGGIPVEFPMIPAGGVYTNLPDMARYLMFHINEGRVDGRPLLRPDLMQAMHSVAFPEHGQRFGYGLGIVVEHQGPEVYYSHGGGGYGFASYMAIYPHLKLGIIYLTNSEPGGEGIEWLSDIVGDLITKSPGAPGAELEKPTFVTAHPLPVTDPRVQRQLGRYTDGIAVGVKDGVLNVTTKNSVYPLAFYEDKGEIVGLFRKDIELRFKPPLLSGQPGSLVLLRWPDGPVQYCDFDRPDKSADSPGPNRPDWARYRGTYKTLDWGRIPSDLLVTVAVDNGYLTVNGQRCHEYGPGLFFSSSGEALDFRGTVATFRNIVLIRTTK